MQQEIYNIALFIANGAAWGLAWLGGLGSVKKVLSNVNLAKLVGLIFAIAGTVYAVHVLHGLYADYSAATTETQKELFKAKFAGKNLFINGGKLFIVCTPILMLLPKLRSSRLISGIVGICYVLLPYYHAIIGKFLS